MGLSTSEILSKGRREPLFPVLVFASHVSHMALAPPARNPG